MPASPTATSAITTDGTTPKLVRFRLAGVRVASPQEQAADQARVQESLLGAFSDGRLNPDRLHTPASPVVPVYEDPDGQRFLGISTPFGPRMIRMRDTPVWDPQRDPSGAGFWSADAIQELANAPQLENPEAMAARMTQAAMQALPASTAEDSASLVEAFLQSSGMGLAQQLAGEGMLQLAGGGNSAGLLNQFVATPGSGLDLTKLGQNLASGLISNVMNMGIQSLMSNWQVDDESSTAEHAAQRAAQALIGKLQGELMNVINEQLAKALGNEVKPNPEDAKSTLEKIKEFFAGPTSTANVPVGRKGDTDTNDGKAETGAATVLANGAEVTCLGDDVSMTNPSVDLGPLESGNPKVLTETFPTAGKGHVAVGLSKGIVTLLDSCSPNVFMGSDGKPEGVKPTPKRIPKSNADAKSVDGNGSQDALVEGAKAGAGGGSSGSCFGYDEKVKAAIEKIKVSKFGATHPDVVNALEKKLREGKIEQCFVANINALAEHTPEGVIRISQEALNSPEQLESVLVHEGAHVVLSEANPTAHSASQEEERMAFEAQLEYYKEQKQHGYSDPFLDKLLNDPNGITKVITNPNSHYSKLPPTMHGPVGNSIGAPKATTQSQPKPGYDFVDESDTSTFQRPATQQSSPSISTQQPATCNYDISDHRITCTSSDGTSFDSSNYVSGQNDANCTDCQNNPDRTSQVNRGPIPEGEYDIGNRRTENGHRRDLTPSPENEMHGRSGFQTHGCSDSATCSEGCIAATTNQSRDQLDEYLDNHPGSRLTVVR